MNDDFLNKTSNDVPTFYGDEHLSEKQHRSSKAAGTVIIIVFLAILGGIVFGIVDSFNGEENHPVSSHTTSNYRDEDGDGKNDSDIDESDDEDIEYHEDEFLDFLYDYGLSEDEVAMIEDDIVSYLDDHSEDFTYIKYDLESVARDDATNTITFDFVTDAAAGSKFTAHVNLDGDGNYLNTQFTVSSE